ncbi:MAG: hypothetical protein JG781_477 [Peptococcaceae bacterium]|jgi:hypothetical protein|nr:hypothetical protein [Peptococcaceae bacterium]
MLKDHSLLTMRVALILIGAGVFLGLLTFILP